LRQDSQGRRTGADRHQLRRSACEEEGRGGAAMVEAFFGFKKTPFNDKPDAKQLFASQAWNQVKARLQYLVDHHGAGLLTGEVGAGKSTAALSSVPVSSRGTIGAGECCSSLPMKLSIRVSGPIFPQFLCNRVSASSGNSQLAVQTSRRNARPDASMSRDLLLLQCARSPARQCDPPCARWKSDAK
jgi:hypothetical protein